jgi:hypothetical protein
MALTTSRASEFGWKIVDEYERDIFKTKESFPEIPEASLEKLLSANREALAKRIIQKFVDISLWPV